MTFLFSFFNVNFPHCARNEVAGARLTCQGQRPPGAFSIDPRRDSRGHPYYWVKIRYPQGVHAAESDLAAIDANRISITPISMDLTDRAWAASLHERLGATPEERLGERVRREG